MMRSRLAPRKIGSKVFEFGKETIKKYLPVLLRELRKQLEPPQKTPTALWNLSAMNINWSNDDNPDAPPREPKPPLFPVAK